MHPNPLLDPLFGEHAVARQLCNAALRGTSVPRRAA